jgi:hypothetical protein
MLLELGQSQQCWSNHSRGLYVNRPKQGPLGHTAGAADVCAGGAGAQDAARHEARRQLRKAKRRPSSAPSSAATPGSSKAANQ